MKSILLLLIFYACALLAGCAGLQSSAPPARPPLPPALQKAEDALRAELQQTRESLKNGGKIADPDKVCLCYFFAAVSGDKNMLKLLKKSGADVNTRNSLTGESALHLAVLNGTPQAVRRLLKLDARIDSENVNLQPVFFDAVGTDNLEVIRILLDHGADPNSCENVFGTTALSGAAMDGKVEVVKLLLERGADPNLGSKVTGTTALHFAIIKGQKDVVELLLKHKADPNLKTKAGTSPLKAALNNQQLEIADLLKQHGAK